MFMFLDVILLVLLYNPKGDAMARLGLHGPYFSSSCFFPVYVSGLGVLLELL